MNDSGSTSPAVMTKQNATLAYYSCQLAKFFLGYKEKTGNNDGPFVNFIQWWVGGFGELGAPWCAAFATLCIHIAAFMMGYTPKIPKSDSSTDLVAFGVANGLMLSAPIAFCLAFQKGSGGNPSKTHHHTCRVLEVNLNAGTFLAIDGNADNAVKLVTHNIKDFDFMAVC